MIDPICVSRLTAGMGPLSFSHWGSPNLVCDSSADAAEDVSQACGSKADELLDKVRNHGRRASFTNQLMARNPPSINTYLG